jgi:hypothetical protein
VRVPDAAVTAWVPDVLVVDAVGVEAQVRAPPDVEFDVLKQNEIEVVAPFAVIEPFKVALVEPTDEAADVVADGT